MNRRFLIAVALLASCAIARAGVVVPCMPGQEYSVQELRAMLPEGDIAFTQAEITPVIAELMPLIERAAGRTFKHRPKVKIVNRDTLMAAIFADRIRACASLDPVADPKQVEKQWMLPMLAYAAPRSILTIARYIERDQTIMVAPRNLETTRKFLRAFDSTTQDVLRAVLALELVRALQSQHGQGILVSDDIEAMYVAANVAEAHAWVVSEAALRMLPDGASAIAARVVLSLPPLKAEELRAHTHLRNENHVLAQLQSGDIPFMRRRYEALGPEACWMVLEHRPERWLDPAVATVWKPAENRWPGIHALFEPVRVQLGEALPRRQSAAEEPGRIAQSMEELLGPIRAPEGTTRVVRLATMIAVDDANTGAFSCTVVQVRNDQDIEWAQEFLRDQEKDQHAMLENGGFEVRVNAPVPLDLVGADWAERSACTIIHGDRQSEITRWRARRGTILIDVTRTQSPVSDEKAVTMLQRMIDACAVPRVPVPILTPPDPAQP